MFAVVHLGVSFPASRFARYVVNWSLVLVVGEVV
jgi:hypothetical protein